MKRSMAMAGVRMLVALALAMVSALSAPARAWAAVDVSDPRVVADSSMMAGQVTTWDCVWLGSYPQTYVDDTDTVAALDAATGWDADGDLTYGGATYRRLRESDATFSDTGSGRWNWVSKASSAGYCYFRWEPIKWRVLEDDGTTALVVADVALNQQRYHETSDEATWATCTLRVWLNSTFWGDAFTIAQQGAIEKQTLVNADNTYYGTDGGANTTDNVFLLAESDVWGGPAASRHGFNIDDLQGDEARWCRPSGYTQAMGAYFGDSSSGNVGCIWVLRSPGRTADFVACTHMDGSNDRNGAFVNALDGCEVRPAMRINLSSPSVYWAGTVSSDGTKDEVALDSSSVQSSSFELGRDNNSDRVPKVGVRAALM